MQCVTLVSRGEWEFVTFTRQVLKAFSMGTLTRNPVGLAQKSRVRAKGKSGALVTVSEGRGHFTERPGSCLS